CSAGGDEVAELILCPGERSCRTLKRKLGYQFRVDPAFHTALNAQAEQLHHPPARRLLSTTMHFDAPFPDVQRSSVPAASDGMLTSGLSRSIPIGIPRSSIQSNARAFFEILSQPG